MKTSPMPRYVFDYIDSIQPYYLLIQNTMSSHYVSGVGICPVIYEVNVCWLVEPPQINDFRWILASSKYHAIEKRFAYVRQEYCF